MPAFVQASAFQPALNAFRSKLQWHMISAPGYGIAEVSSLYIASSPLPIRLNLLQEHFEDAMNIIHACWQTNGLNYVVLFNRPVVLPITVLAKLLLFNRSIDSFESRALAFVCRCPFKLGSRILQFLLCFCFSQVFLSKFVS